MAEFKKPTTSAPFLLTKLQDKSMTPEQLTPHQRRICVRFLLEEGKHTQVQIAAILRVGKSTVTEIKHRIMDQNAWMLDDIDERRAALNVIHVAELASANLFRQGKSKDAWTVQKEAIELMQSLGYVKKKPMELDIKAESTLVELLKLAADSDQKDETNILRAEGRNLQALKNGD